MKLRALVVGLGKIGMAYDRGLDPKTYALSHCRALQQHPDFELVAGVDVSEEARSQFQHDYRRPGFASIADLPVGLGVDVVALAVPTPKHLPLCREVIERLRPRGLLCEKPLAESVAQARALVTTCERAEVVLAVNYMRRSEPGVLEIGRRIRSGEIATPVRGVAWYSKGLLHNGSHLVNLLQFWLGSVVAGRWCDQNRDQGPGDGPDVVLEFEGGVVHFLAVSEENFSHYTVELIAPNGRLRYDAGGANVLWQAVEPSRELAGYRYLAKGGTVVASDMRRVQWHVVDQWSRKLQGEVSNICSGAEALATQFAIAFATERA